MGKRESKSKGARERKMLISPGVRKRLSEQPILIPVMCILINSFFVQYELCKNLPFNA